MKKYAFIIIAILVLSCNNSKKLNIENEKVVKRELRPFFDSDEIDHYYLNFSESDFSKLSKKEKLNKKEEEFFNIFVHSYPDSLPREDFEQILLNHKYKKTKLSSKQQCQIENVFREKDSLPEGYFACAAEYRDIFIFKKKEKLIGVAKICFKCGRFQIVGSKLNTEGFGLWKELDKLKSIVRK